MIHPGGVASRLLVEDCQVWGDDRKQQKAYARYFRDMKLIVVVQVISHQNGSQDGESDYSSCYCFSPWPVVEGKHVITSLL